MSLSPSYTLQASEPSKERRPAGQSIYLQGIRHCYISASDTERQSDSLGEEDISGQQMIWMRGLRWKVLAVRRRDNECRQGFLQHMS